MSATGSSENVKSINFRITIWLYYLFMWYFFISIWYKSV